MSEIPRGHLGQRILSTLLDLYLSFVSFCGLIGTVGTIYFGYGYRDDLKDLLMVIRFNPETHQHLSDVELQRLSPGNLAVPNVEEDTGYRGATTSSDNARPR